MPDIFETLAKPSTDIFDALAPTQAPAPPEERGLIGETAAGFKRGGLQLVDMAGNIARAVDPEGGVDVVRNAGFGMSKFAKERALQPDVAESSYVEEHPILGNIPKAAEMVIPSVGIPLAIGVGSAAAGLTGPAAAAAGIIGSGAAFGVSQFQDTKERGIEKGLTPEDATTAGIKTGLSEGGLEAASNIIPATKLFKLGKPVAGQVIKSLFGAPTFKAAAKTLINDAAQIMVGEVSTEMAQAYTQGLTEKNAGIRPDADPWQEAKDVIGPTIALSLMLGGAVGGANKLSKIATQRALTSPNVGEDVRRQAVDNVYSGLVAAEADNQAPAGSAENFKINALEAIKNKEPLVLSDELLTPATPKVVVTQEEAAANVLANLAEGMSPSEAIEEHNAEVVSTKNDVDAEAQVQLEEANQALAEQLNLPDVAAPPTPEPELLAPQVPEPPTQDTFTRPDNVAPTGEVLGEPVMTDPLEALKGYKTKEAAYKEIKKSGRMETHETALRADGMVVIVPKGVKEVVPEVQNSVTATPALQAGTVQVKQTFAEKGVANATQMITHNEAAKTNSDSLANHPSYDGSFPIPVQGGLQAAKISTEYANNPVYREQVDAFERALDADTYNLWREKKIYEQALASAPKTEKLSASTPAGTGVKSKYNVDIRGIWNSEAKMAYGGYSLGNIATREMLQNSLDAVIVAMRRGLIKKGKIDLNINTDKGRISIEDNGIGMSAQDIGDRFLTLANQSKNALGESVFGGFGAAKAVILGWAEKTNWKLWSRDVYTDSDITAADGDVVFADKPRIGTKLETSADLESDDYSGWQSFSTSDLPIYIDYTVMPAGVSMTYNGQASKNPTPGRAAGSYTHEFNDGATTTTTTVYKHVIPRLDKGQVVLRLSDPTTGAKLVQGLDMVYDFEGTAIVDITTSLKPGERGYPFTKSRNSLDYGAVRNTINGYIESFKPKPKEDKKDETDKTIVDLAESKEWKTALRKLERDPQYLKIQELVKAYAEADDSITGPAYISQVSSWGVAREKKAKLPVGSVGMLRLASVYEVALRMAGRANKFPVGQFQLLDYSAENSVAANFGATSTGFNARSFDYSLIDSPSELLHYLKALSDHEVTHYVAKDHDQLFANTLVDVSKNSGTAANWKLLSDMVDVLTGKTEPLTVAQDEQRIDEMAAGIPATKPQDVRKYIGEEQYELFTRTQNIELFNPYATDDQLELDFTLRAPQGDANTSGDVVGDQPDRGGSQTDSTGTGSGVQPGQGEKVTFTEDEQQHFLNGIPSQYRDAQGRAELLGIVDTNIARLKDEIDFEDVGSDKIDALQTSLNNLYQTKAMLESFEEKGVGDVKQRRAVPDEQGIQEAAPMEETTTSTRGLRDVDGVSGGAAVDVDRTPVLPGNGTSREADSERGTKSRPDVEIFKGSQDTPQTGTKPDLGKTKFLALDKPSYGSAKLKKIQEEAFIRAMDRDIAQRVGTDTGVKKSALATLRRAVKQLTDDKMSPNMFAMEVESALLSMEERRAAASAKGGERVRGADYIRQKLLEAKRRGDITQKATDFAEWFIMKNPKLYDDLGIGIRSIEGAAGRYVPFERLMTLAKGKDGSLTAVHEMFHHLERMMPPALQNTIRKEWLNAVAKEFSAEQKKDASSERAKFLEAVLVNQINGTQLDQNKYVELFNASTLHESDYKYLNASEFWAEKMTTRADAMYAASSLQGKIKVWLKEAWQHIKATLGLDGDSKLYKAMDSIIKGDGKFLSDQMLSKTEQNGFASSLFDPKEQTSALKEWYDKSALRSLQDAANKVYRYIMPVDRVITLAMSQADYKPIRSLLGQIQKQKQAKSGYIQSAMDSGYYGIQDIKKHFKSKEELQALSDLAFKATIYELHADPAQAKEWTAKSWEESGQLERTGKTLGQAQKEISDIYAKFTKEQKTAHRTMLDQVQKMYLDGREASLAPWVNKFGRDMVKQAEAYNAAPSETASQDVKDLAAIVANIDLKYPMLKGDYMPLMRFGEYTVRTFDIDENGEVGKRTRMEMFDTQQEALDYVEMINGNSSKTQHAVIEKNVQVTRESVNIPANLIDKLRGLAERQFAKQYPNATPEEAREHAQTIEKLISDAEELRINMTPRVSTAGNKLHREGIEGYSTNLYKVYASYVSNHANANAGLIYGTKIEQTFRDMSNAVKAYTSERGYDPKSAVRMDNLQKTLYKEELESKKIRLNEFVKGTGKLSFFWYLSSPSIWMVQWSQPFMITVPKLASKFGYGTALKAYSLAAKRYLHGDFSDEKINDFNRTHEFVGDEIYRRIEQSRDATPQERTKLEREIKSLFDGYKNDSDRRLIVLKVLSLQGNIDLSASHSFRELAEASNKGDRLVDKVSSGTNFVLDKASFFMRHSETGSRRAAAVASFELAYKREGFIGANDYAGAIINDTLYDMSSGNRGTAWRGNTGHILGQFQFFRMHTLGKMIQLAKDAMGGEYKRAIAEAKGDKKLIEAAETARSEARKEMAYMVGTSFALAGAAGTPIALALGNTATTAIFSALSYMFGDPDDPWDFQKEFENAVREAMGETAGNVVLKGLPSLVGADISRRIGLGGMGDVINGDPPAGATGTAKANWYAGRLLGPAWGMVSDQMRAIDSLADGNLADAAKFSTPKGIRDLIKTADVADKGVTGGGKTILKSEDVGLYSMALMAVGINPLDVSLAQEESRYLKNLSTEMSHRRSMLIRDLATATVNGDVDAKEARIEAINTWSAKNPKLRITAQELAQGVKKMRDKQAGKLTKREMLIKERAGQ